MKHNVLTAKPPVYAHENSEHQNSKLPLNKVLILIPLVIYQIATEGDFCLYQFKLASML